MTPLLQACEWLPRSSVRRIGRFSGRRGLRTLLAVGVPQVAEAASVELGEKSVIVSSHPQQSVSLRAIVFASLA